MARMRTVKPEFFRSATIGKLHRDARLLFIGMWTEADDHGRGLAEPRHLAGTLFPFDRDVTERKIMRWLHELADVRLIALYDVNGSTYYAVRGWHHQKVNRPGDARYPEPPSGTLFDPSIHENDTPSSVNDPRQMSPPDPIHSLNRGRQGSGFRDQGSGVREGEGGKPHESFTESGPPPPNDRASHTTRKPTPDDEPARLSRDEAIAAIRAKTAGGSTGR
jgi:hypothetical protein